MYFKEIKTLGLLSLTCLVLISVIVSCSKSKFIARDTTSPELAYCNDITGHVEGNKPYPLGGDCTCTPDEEHYTVLQEEGSISENISYDEFLGMYRSQGIVTDLNESHEGDNNMCDLGPHVVMGGSCMATPTPGTLNYERVVSGNPNLTEVEHNHEGEGEKTKLNYAR